MKKIGTITYNRYCDFTNYGSALQTWALLRVIRQFGYDSLFVDYCPPVLEKKNPLYPLHTMWDQDEESIRNCEMSLQAIEENYYKFETFYNTVCSVSEKKYTSENINTVIQNEHLDGFVCGSDTIFCIDEFKGFDNGYFANYPVMKGKSIAYAASFGDSCFDQETGSILNDRLQNFKAIGIREPGMLQYVREHTDVPCERTIDPTLLLTSKDYDTIASERQYDGSYLLLYTRRYDPIMETYAEKVASERGLKIVEISLRATNAQKGHIMRYDAGVEEFLSLVKHSDFIVTNSFHGVIFAVQYKRPLAVFSREQAGNKIKELLDLFGMQQSKLVTGRDGFYEVNYEKVHENISLARTSSVSFLKMGLELI